MSQSGGGVVGGGVLLHVVIKGHPGSFCPIVPPALLEILRTLPVQGVGTHAERIRWQVSMGRKL